MTKRVAQHLKLLKRAEPGIKIAGIDQSEIVIDETAEVKIKYVSNYHILLKLLIVSKITTGGLPSTSIIMLAFKILIKIILTNASFHGKGKIDLLFRPRYIVRSSVHRTN